MVKVCVKVAEAVEKIKRLPETDGYDKKVIDEFILTNEKNLCINNEDILEECRSDVIELLCNMYPEKYFVKKSTSVVRIFV